MIESNAKFWEAVYRQNIGKLIGICYRYTSDRQLAEDLPHDAFLKAIDKAGSFNGDGVFEGWLRRVVVNHVLTYIRDKKRHQRVDDWLWQESNVVHPDENSMIPDTSQEAGFSTQELLDVINDLPEHHRLVFNLYVIDNFKHAQIADQLGISEGTSKSHLARARKRIRKLLAGKAAEKKGRSRAIILFLFPYNAWSMSKLYNRRFHHYELADHKALPDFSTVPSIPTSMSSVSVSWIHIAAALVVGSLMVVTTIFYLMQQNRKADPFKAELIPPIVEDSIDTKITQQASPDVIRTDKKNNSRSVDSSAATVPGNSVIQHKIIKSNRMKTLDSLGMALLVSSGLALDSVAQSPVQVTTATPETHVVTRGNDPVKTTSILHFSASNNVKKSEKQKGTFYATSLHWSAENHELYFKGKVKVDVGENNFVSSGSVTFLGKVYLLMIDDKPVKLDSTIKLSQQEYRLTQLNNREAINKYGPEGENGAVEINVVE